MNQRVEKLEENLENQQIFLTQFLRSLQEVKPSDENWEGTFKSLQTHLDKITFSKNDINRTDQQEDEDGQEISLSNIQKELIELKNKEAENQKTISMYNEKMENMEKTIGNQKKIIEQLINQTNSLSNQAIQNNKSSSIQNNNNNSDDNLKADNSFHQLREVVNSHSTQISALLDSPAYSLPSDVDFKIYQFDSDLRLIKTMISNQDKLWFEFESTIQALVRNDGNDSSGSDDKVSNEPPRRHSQKLQEQVFRMTDEIKQIRRELSAFSEQQQESMKISKGIDMPKRFNKINDEIGNLSEKIKSSQILIDSLSEKVQTNTDESSEKVNQLFEIVRKIQSELSDLRSWQIKSDKLLIQLQQALDPNDDFSNTVLNNSCNSGSVNDGTGIMSNSANASFPNESNASGEAGPVPLKAQMKHLAEQTHEVQVKSSKNSESIEKISKNMRTIIQTIKNLNSLTNPIKSLQESQEAIKKELKQIQLENQQRDENISTREIKLSEDESKNKEIKQITETYQKEVKESKTQIDSLTSQVKELQENVGKLQADSQKHVVISSENSANNSLTNLLNTKRDRSNTTSNGQQPSVSNIPLAQSSSTQSRELFNWSKSRESFNDSNANIDENGEIDFDDLAQSGTPFTIKTSFETTDDIVDAFKAVSNEQNRQRRVTEQLIDVMKQSEVKTKQLKYLEKMINELRNRSQEQADVMASMKVKQADHDKNIIQFGKFMRSMETLNIHQELHDIKKQMKSISKDKNSYPSDDAKPAPKSPTLRPFSSYDKSYKSSDKKDKDKKDKKK